MNAFAASEFVTVFEITGNSNGVLMETALRLFIGIAALIGGVRALVRPRRNNAKDWVGASFAIIFSLFWLYVHNFPHSFGHINTLLRAYRDRHYHLVEGPVKVIHQQPATGHSKGDLIAVNGEQFEVNYFLFTPAYRKTLAHDGVLGAGVYARLYHYNGEILRIDIRK